MECVNHIKKLVGILVIVLCFVILSNFVSAGANVQVSGTLDTQLLSGQRISFKEGQTEIASGIVEGNTYGKNEKILLEDLTFGDKIKVYIGTIYSGMITVDKKVVERDLKVAHLVPQVISGTRPNVKGEIKPQEEPEQFAKESSGFLYVLLASLIFIALAGSGLIFATKTGVISLKKKEYKKETVQTSDNHEDAIVALKKYITYYRGQGYNDSQIKQGLINGGWDESTLNQFLQ